MNAFYAAPWSLKLKLTTTLLGVLGVAGMWMADTWVSRVVILTLVVGCGAFMVRGYRIAGGNLYILRLGWSITFPLSSLTTASAQPGITAGSLRTWGIGGLFGFVGWFHNDRLGSYRAYVTDAEKAVVLNFDGQYVVISPDDPVRFVEVVCSTVEE